MITKDQLGASMIRDCEICKHLHGKLDASSQDYRPSPAQRSTLELLQYLSIAGIAGTRCMAAADWKLFGSFAERAAKVAFADFPAAMDLQIGELREFFAATSAETFTNAEAPLPGGGVAPLGLAILGGPAKWLPAYRMQLFLYAKACGAKDLGTANLWAGVDRSA